MTSIIQNKAGLIGIRSAVIGSLAFAIVEGIMLGTNGSDTFTEAFRFKFLWSIFVFCTGTVLSIVPGYLGGGILERHKQNSNLNRHSLIVLGAIMGMITVVLISLPDLLFFVLSAHNYWNIKNNPAFTIYIIRLIEVVIIAGAMGSWSASLIAKS
jgi:hypothetical protein